MANSAQVENSVLTFERIYERMRVANNLLKQFDMYALTTEPDLFATFQKMMDRLQGVIVQDAMEVAKKSLSSLSNCTNRHTEYQF